MDEAMDTQEPREGVMSHEKAALEGPFSVAYFGGKAKIASLVWDRLGDPANFIEPFMGSAAVLLARPHPPRIETANDACCYLTNFWRATKYDPEGVVEWADWPVHEADLHANHRWLVLGRDAEAFRHRMKTDPDFYDVKVAGRWCQGICSWIGSGWAQSPESAEWEQLPEIGGGRDKGASQRGVHAPIANGPAGGSGELPECGDRL